MKTSTDDAATSMQDNGECAFSSDDINLPAGKRIEPGARPPTPQPAVRPAAGSRLPFGRSHCS